MSYNRTPRRERRLKDRERLLREHDREWTRLPAYPAGAQLAKEIDQKLRSGRMNEKFDGYLKRRRARAGLTQKQAADRIGASVQTLRGWERGGYWPSAYWIPLLAAAYGCSIEELYLTPEEARK